MPCVGHKNNERINHFLYIIYQNNHIYITTLETVHTSQVSLNILYPSMWQVSCNTVCHSPVKHIQPFIVLDQLSKRMLSSTHPVYKHTRLTALFPGLPRWAGTRKVKLIWILLKQETVSGNGISWAICKLAPCSRQTTTSAPHHSVFYRPDALLAAQPTVSKHWRNNAYTKQQSVKNVVLNWL